MPKFSLVLLFGLICLCKKLRREKAVYACRFAHGGEKSLSEPGAFLREAPVCKKLIPKLVPIRPKNLPQHVGAMSWYHAKFHDFQACFGFTGIKKPSFSIFSADPRRPDVRISFPFLAWELEIHPRTHMRFSTNLDALEHLLVVQIWIMHIKCPVIQLMYKQGQTNTE